MGHWKVVTKDHANGGAIAKVVDIPLRILGVGGVTEVGEEEQRMTEVGDSLASLWEGLARGRTHS